MSIPRLIASLAAAIVLALTFTMARAIEQPQYQVIEQRDGFEIREYAPYIAAQVRVPGPADEAGNQGFRLLAGYIFGRNKGDRKIAMTAPVTQSPAPVKIDMTAPVTQSETEGGYIVQFTMPSQYTLDTLPEPLDPEIELRPMPAARYAVIRYSGFWSENNYDQHLRDLERAVRAAGLATTGSPVYARYDPPWIPWFLRRNEIWLKLA
jgi:hypothetical protein